MLLSYSYPARLQQALLPPDTVLNVDQTQQILLRHKGKEEQSDKERKTFGEHYQNLWTFFVSWAIFTAPFVLWPSYHQDQALMSCIVPSRMSQSVQKCHFSTSAAVNVKTIVDSSLLRLYVGKLFELNANRSCVSGSLTAIKSFWPFVEPKSKEILYESHSQQDCV